MISIQTLFIIVLCIFTAVFLAGILLIVYLFGRRSVKDNPNLASIFLKTGLHIGKPIKGKLSDKTAKGFKYSYKLNRAEKIVLVPASYKEHYYCNRRSIYINRLGQLVASPFFDDVSLDETEKEDLIYELITSHIGRDGMKALKGKQSPASIVVIAIIAFVIGVVAVFGYQYMQSAMQPKPQQTQQNLPTPIEVK